MRKTLLALAVGLGTWLPVSAVFAEEPMSLAAATQKTLSSHPLLQVFTYREQALEGLRQTAGNRPAFEVGAELENFAGTGVTSGVDDAELTVALSSVVELGGKRQARLRSLDARSGLLQTQRQAQALDILGGMARQFITVLALQERLALARDAEALAEETIGTVKVRVDAGAAPDAELQRAHAIRSQAHVTTTKIARELQVAKVTLASFWGERRDDPADVRGDLSVFGTAIDFAALYRSAVESPAIQIYASEERLTEAAVQLAQSRSKSDLRWSLGVRRLEGPGDTALVASVQLPLFSGRRNRGDVAAAEAERGEVGIRREQALNTLYVRLFEGYLTRAQSIEATQTLQEETIPALTEALASTRSAYESGRYSYLDLIAAQQALLEARATLIDAATAALHAGVVIEQLTGLPLDGGNTGNQRKEHVQ